MFKKADENLSFRRNLKDTRGIVLFVCGSFFFFVFSLVFTERLLQGKIGSNPASPLN